jgi:hypothetical protein
MILSLTACAVKRDPASIAGWCCHCYSTMQEFAQLFASAKTLVWAKIPRFSGLRATCNVRKCRWHNVFLKMQSPFAPPKNIFGEMAENGPLGRFATVAARNSGHAEND